MRVVWTERASFGLRSIRAFIARDNPAAATRVTERIVQQAAKLAEFPERGRIGRVQGTREFVIARTSYVVAYRLHGQDIEILAVVHGGQRWPKRLQGNK